jgi:GTP cyclohydrolase II
MRLDNESGDAYLACERAAFELSRERTVAVVGQDGECCVMTAETYLIEFGAQRISQAMAASARLVVTAERAAALGRPALRAVAIDVAALPPSVIGLLAGVGGLPHAGVSLPSGVAPADPLESALLSLARMAGRLPAMIVLRPNNATGISPRAFPLTEANLRAGTRSEAQPPLRLSHLFSIHLPLRLAERSRLHLWRDDLGREYHALEIGEKTLEPPVVRLHSECFTGDVLGSLRCDCEVQLIGAIERISRAGHGVLIYLPQEGRGIGLTNKLRTYRLQEHGTDTYAANSHLGFGEDERDFQAASTILEELGIAEVDLLSNNPDKSRELEADGIRVRKVVSHDFGANPHNTAYIRAKRIREHSIRTADR